MKYSNSKAKPLYSTPRIAQNIEFYGLIRSCCHLIFQDLDKWLVKGSLNIHVSTQKSAEAIISLLSREPEPYIDYVYGLCRLKRIELQGKGTKKDPLTAKWCNDYFKDPI